ETVFEDKDNNLWVGTSRGLNKADLTRWQMGFMSLDPQNPFSFLNNFYAIGEIEKDVFWFGLDGDGFVEWNRKTNEKKHFNNTDPRAKEGIQVIKKDQDGIFWLGHKQNGLSRYNSKTGKLDNYQNNANDPSSLVSNFVTDIIIDRNNDIWISTSQGLSKFNRKEKNFSNWQKEVNAPEMSGNALFSLFQDSKGFIWIGTKDQPVDPNSKFPTGLMKFDPETNHFTTYRSNPNDASSLSSDAIYVVNEDLNGNIWVGTNNGLNKLDINGEKFEVYHTADGLADPNIIGILIDDDGNIWLSTLKGISRFNPKTKKFRNYDFEDGIQGYRYNDNSRLKTSTGELFFGGVAGANFYNPAEVSSEKVVPNILITKFLIQNTPFHFHESIDKTEKVELAWDENSIGFEFVAINFRSSQQTQYEYKLEGLEKEWVQAGTRRFVNYTHLPIGNYTFRVRAVNAERIYSEKDAILKIKIIPPFWRTWLAYIIYALIFIGIIFVIDHFQRIRLLRKEKEKAKDRELAQAKEIEKSYTELKATQAQLIQSEKMASL
ncbi:MAG: two-component regulator propeller domain-containing protein, partial [Ignavibacteria bacterium]|nr:two-component regulator propeller domain-containing protein [Ignavibacteria bacterium]